MVVHFCAMLEQAYVFDLKSRKTCISWYWPSLLLVGLHDVVVNVFCRYDDLRVTVARREPSLSFGRLTWASDVRKKLQFVLKSHRCTQVNNGPKLWARDYSHERDFGTLFFFPSSPHSSFSLSFQLFFLVHNLHPSTCFCDQTGNLDVFFFMFRFCVRVLHGRLRGSQLMVYWVLWWCTGLVFFI